MIKPLLFSSLLLSSAAIAQTTVTFNANGIGRNGTVQQFVVPPCVNSVDIDVYGAQGGNSNGGLGSRIKGTFSVTSGDTLYIAVGQQGTVNTCGGVGASSGGGGGSFVWKSNGPSRTLLAAAGGGGGGNTNWAGGCIAGINAVVTADGTQGNGPTSAMGGTAGAGGFGNAPSGTGSGGAGWLSAGQNSTYGTGCTGGLSWPLFTGGSGSTSFGSPGEGDGGFGGGGGAVCGNGAGGGYSGGGGGEGSSCRAGGGGGGSFNGGTNQTNTPGIRTGNGQVIVSYIQGGFTAAASVTPNDTVCAGTQVTLIGANASTYNWNNSVVNAVPFTATTSTTYQLIAANAAGCLDTILVSLTVLPRPVVAANASPANTICAGDLLTLSGSGASSYSWTNSVVDAVPFAPAASSVYTVTGTGANGCTNTATVQVTVNALPVVGYSAAPDDTVCAGTSVAVSGTGASTYVWSNGVSDGVPFTPTVSGNYVVTGTDANGCSSTDTVELIVNQNPVVNLGADITQVMPPVVLDAGAGYSNYLWSTMATSQTISVNSFGNYWVQVTDANGCTDSDTILVTFTVGVAETIGNGSFSLYPNPSPGLLNLSLSNVFSDDVVMNVNDVNGRVVFSQRIGKVDGTLVRSFDLSHLSAGSYVITLTASGNISTQVWEKK